MFESRPVRGRHHMVRYVHHISGVFLLWHCLVAGRRRFIPRKLLLQRRVHLRREPDLSRFILAEILGVPIDSCDAHAPAGCCVSATVRGTRRERARRLLIILRQLKIILVECSIKCREHSQFLNKKDKRV